jgi:hypothetical protein
MEWNEFLIKYWIEHFHELHEYELNPFEETRIFIESAFNGKRFIIPASTGRSTYSTPYEDTVDLNIEFDHALDKLSDKERFKRLYIDGQGEDKELFKEFVKILMEVSNETS